MLAALPAQPASGLQGLVRAASRSKQTIAVELKPEQQNNPDSSPAPVHGVFPSNHHPDSISNLPAAVASTAATTVPLVSILCRY